jgi:hypothetical protein
MINDLIYTGYRCIASNINNEYLFSTNWFKYYQESDIKYIDLNIICSKWQILDIIKDGGNGALLGLAIIPCLLIISYFFGFTFISVYVLSYLAYWIHYQRCTSWSCFSYQSILITT